MRIHQIKKYRFLKHLVDKKMAFQMALVVKNLPANTGDIRLTFDPWVGKILGGGHGNAFQ